MVMAAVRHYVGGGGDNVTAAYNGGGCTLYDNGGMYQRRCCGHSIVGNTWMAGVT